MSSGRGWRTLGPALLAAALLLTAPPSIPAQEPGDAPAPYLDAELLAAWEEQLRADPQTVHLEEVGPGRYRYATRLFPTGATTGSGSTSNRVLHEILEELRSGGGESSA